MADPQNHPYPKDFISHKIRVIDPIVDADQCTDKDYVDAAIAAIPDPLNYKGTWDASTNTPTLANTDTGVEGFLYRCNVAGTVDFGAGNITFTVGDFAVNNGTIWEKWDAGDLVSSVFGRVGDVVATASDYDASQIDNDSGVTGTYVSNALDTLDADKVEQSDIDTSIQTFKEALSWQDVIISLWDVDKDGLPGGPSVGDRYRSTTDGSGWTAPNIYEWDGSAWEETLVKNGDVVVNLGNSRMELFWSSAWTRASILLTHSDMLELLWSTAGHTMDTTLLMNGHDIQNIQNAVNPQDAVAFSQLISTNIAMSQLGSPTYDDLQDFINTTQSSGCVDGGVISDGGGGTADTTTGKGFIRATDSSLAEILMFDFPLASGLSLTDQVDNFIFVSYNAGSPNIQVETNRSNIDDNTEFVLGTVFRDGTTLHITETSDGVLNDFPRALQHRLREVEGLSRAFGLILGETGTRNITSSAGEVYVGISESIVPAFDSSGADTFSYYYRDGGVGWTKVASQTQIDNTQYDDGDGTLGTLTNNRYGVHWVYEHPDGDMFVVYGQGDYLLSQAEASQPPTSLPPVISNNSTVLLIGRIIILKSASSFTETQSAFDVQFTATAASDHDDLANVTANQHHNEDHAARHVDGSDDIQSATNAQKGLATAAHITAIEANTAHASSNGTSHANVVLNDTHRGSAGTDHSDVGLNNTHRGTVTGNPHAISIADLDSGTLSELNTNISDATLVDTTDARFSDDRDPNQHGISDNARHSGVGGATTDNIITFDGNGLPKDSGVAIGAVTSGTQYQGTWNASTNTPTLADGTGTLGHFYIVLVAGTQDLGSGSQTFNINDWVLHNGSIWQQIDHTDQVASVFGRIGAVTAQVGDYTAAQVTNAFDKTADKFTAGLTDTLANLNTAISDATVLDTGDIQYKTGSLHTAADHENAGGLEIDVGGLSGELADDQPPKSHGNAAHSSTFITSTGVTYENLDANGDVGAGATQVAQGNHTHAHSATTGKTANDHHNQVHDLDSSDHGTCTIDELATRITDLDEIFGTKAAQFVGLSQRTGYDEDDTFVIEMNAASDQKLRIKMGTLREFFNEDWSDKTWSYNMVGLGDTFDGHVCSSASSSLLDSQAGETVERSLAFDDSTPESTIFTMKLPKAYKAGENIIFKISWKAAATSGNCRWGVGISPIGNNEDAKKNYSYGYVTDTPGGTTYYKQTAQLTLNGSTLGLNPEDDLRFVLLRDPTVASNMTGDALLSSVQIEEA